MHFTCSVRISKTNFKSETTNKQTPVRAAQMSASITLSLSIHKPTLVQFLFSSACGQHYSTWVFRLPKRFSCDLSSSGIFRSVSTPLRWATNIQWRSAVSQKTDDHENSTSLCIRNTFNVEKGRWRRWRTWLSHCATRRKVAGSIPDGVIGIFFRQHYGPGVDSASNRNEYREYFLRVKTADA